MQKTKLPDSLTWRAHAQEKHERSNQWYIIFGLVFLGLVAFAVFIDHNVLTLITFVVMFAVVLLFTLQPTSVITYQITPSGIHIGSTEFSYKIIKSFWIVYTPGVKTLNFETTAYLNNTITAQLGDQDPVEVKLVLDQYIPEDLDRGESATQTLARKLKI